MERTEKRREVSFEEAKGILKGCDLKETRLSEKAAKKWSDGAISRELHWFDDDQKNVADGNFNNGETVRYVRILGGIFEGPQADELSEYFRTRDLDMID